MAENFRVSNWMTCSPMSKRGVPLRTSTNKELFVELNVYKADKKRLLKRESADGVITYGKQTKFSNHISEVDKGPQYVSLQF